MDIDPLSSPLFEIRRLSKAYGQKRVLDDVSFDVGRGECLVVLGRSGSGKSVLLRQLNGLERPDGGSVVFDGIELSALTERELFPLRRRIAMLFQSGAMFDSLTVGQNVGFPIAEHTDKEPGAIADLAVEKLRMVGLEGIADKMPSALSGGMRKRAALARSLALDPEVILFDEPTTGLDPVTSAAIGHLIRSTQERLGTTSVVVTHDLALARAIADRIGFLSDQTFRFLGSWEEARAAGDAALTDFLEGRFREADVA